MGSYSIVDDGLVPDASDWCFAIGPARTGSSALTKVISLHPDAIMYNEAWLWGFAEQLQTHELTEAVGNVPTKIWLLLQELGNRDQDGFGYIGYNEPVPDLPASVVRRFMDGVRDAFYPDVQMFGDKRNVYRYVLEDVNNVFPNCKLIYTDRDDWDSIASAFKRGRQQNVFGGMTRKQVARECYRRICARNEDIAQKGIRDGTSSWDVHVVSFEDMASDLEDTTRSLLEYLGLNPDIYPWDRLTQSVHYDKSVGRQHDIPEVMELKERHNGDTGR